MNCVYLHFLSYSGSLRAYWITWSVRRPCFVVEILRRNTLIYGVRSRVFHTRGLRLLSTFNVYARIRSYFNVFLRNFSTMKHGRLTEPFNTTQYARKRPEYQRKRKYTQSIRMFLVEEKSSKISLVCLFWTMSQWSWFVPVRIFEYRQTCITGFGL